MTLREKINDIIDGTDSMHITSGEEYRASRDAATNRILAAVAEAMMSDEVIDRTVKITNRSPAITQLIILGVIEALRLTAAGVTEREE